MTQLQFNLNFDEIKEMLIRSNLDDLLKSTGVLMSLHQYPTSTAAFTIYIKSFLSFWSSRKMPLVVAMPPSITSTVTWPYGVNALILSCCSFSKSLRIAHFTFTFILLISPPGKIERIPGMEL